MRVPVGLDWEVGKVWFGYLLPEILCECCIGVGDVIWEIEAEGEGQEAKKQTITCPIYNGTGKAIPIIEVPKGNGYQIWETQNYFTGENEHHYYPFSPIFRTAFDLAEWCSRNLIINNDQLFSESTWYDAIEENNVDVVFGLHRDNITGPKTD